MKNNNKEKWINEVFESMEGSQRLKPPIDLFKRIEDQIDIIESKVIPMNQFRIGVAAAIILFHINVFSLYQFVKKSSLNAEELIIENISNQQFFSDYKIYE